ncbi:unnamed protein product, partial [Ectocarpus sp. 12 AP-2014]
QDEVREYAKWLGMELQDDLDLFWIAKEGLKAPLPENWKPCKTVDTDEIYYFNFATGESTWDHPCDEYYRKLYEEEKKKKITKDKAKHDKSKQQAKKDVNQLLGRDKKKKGRPTGKRPTHRSSPERAQAKPLSASSVLDRKPLPGIGRQSVQGRHTVDSQASVSSPTPSDKALTLSDRSPSQTQTSSLVGHRLSQHLSVSVESEEGIRKTEDGGRKPSSLRTPVRSKEENATTPVPTALAAGLQSEHEAALKASTELRREHARNLDALEQAHSDTKHELEADHRRNMATKRRQWAASAEAQSKKARDAMTHELQAMRSNHSREIDKLECSLLDAKARMEKAMKETEEAREATHAKKGALESTLAELERQVSEEKEKLQEAREAAKKNQALEVSQPGEDLRRELARVLLELEDERKHVAELQGQVKEANSAIRDDFNCAQHDGEGVGTKLVLLEQKLALAIRENEGLRKEAARATSLGVGGRYGEVSANESGATKPEHIEITTLKRALHEAEMSVSELQRDQDQSIKDAQDAAAALANVHEKAAGVEQDNQRLVAEVAKYRVQVQGATGGAAQNLGDDNTMPTRKLVGALQGQDTGTQTSLPLEHDGNTPTKQLDTEGLRADLEAARHEAACFASDAHKSKELENLARNELHAVQLALRESQLKIAELNGNLATADHEKKLSAVTVEELRLENACLKRNIEVVRSASEGNASRQVADTLVDELKQVRVQLATMTSERDGLNDEVGAMKQQLVRCEGARKAEREMFDSSLANQQRQSESLQATVKRLEVDMLAGQQREEALHIAAKLLRENVAASKLEVWRLQENLRETTEEAERVASDLISTEPEIAQTSCQKGESEAELASAADLARATAEAQEMASRLQLAEDQVDRLQASVQDTMTKLVDSQGIAASLQGELDKARGSEKDTAQHLDEALSRCAKAEENLAKACDDRVSLEHALRDAKRTTVADKQCSDLEQSLRRSHGDLEQAKTDLVSSKQQAADLQQRLPDSTAEASRAMEEARHNREMASTRQKEIVSVSEREQGLRGELLQARTSLHTREKDCERLTVSAEQAKHDLVNAESVWREETRGLKIALKEALATAGKKDENNARSATHKETSQRSPVASEAQGLFPPRPEVAVDGDPALADEGPQRSASGGSNATSRGLADELMQSLESDANQPCNNGPPALSEKASRSWKKKLMEERHMLAQAKEAVRHHKERVKRRQQRILLCQTRWRQQIESLSPTKARPRHSARRRSLEDTKRELDSEVHKLNKFVQQLRSSKYWLDQREKKVSEFETLLAADSSGLRSSQEQYPSRVATPGEQTSSESSNSGGSTRSNASQFRSLEAMQQELDNDFSDFTAGSSIGDFGRPRAMRGDKKPTRTQRHAPKQGKENTSPGSRSAFPIGYPFSAFPAASGFWIHPSHAFLREFSPPPAGIPSRSRESRPEHNVRHRGRGLGSGVQVNNCNQDSELDFQRWLNRPDLDTRDEVRSGIASRERREHFAKLSMEGKQAQTTVALHVDWLNTLREEMGLLGFHSTKSPSISAHVEV